MRLLNLNKYMTGFRSVKEIYKHLVLMEIEKLKASNDLSLKQFFNLYTEEDLRKALDSIQYDGKGFMLVQEHTKNNLILRYLEFGGESVKPTHILSKAKLALDKYFNMEDR